MGGRRSAFLVRLAVIGVGVCVCVCAAGGTSSDQQLSPHAQERLSKGQPGQWSPWTPWSECSRPCGGGVTTQTRQCRSKPLGRHRRRTHSIVSQHHCIGLYKRIRICNTTLCPGTREFRQEQCARYDGKQFLGRAYDWEPFLDAPDQCALNCRARGFRFYATLNASVEDGTPCRGYILGRDRHAHTWACVRGQCKHVGCEGAVGSAAVYDACGVCGGDNSTCRLVSGLFTRPQMPVGYNLIARIPRAACNLSVAELKQSRNYLALRKSDGSFLLNGNWAINWSGEFEALGARFVYRREDDAQADAETIEADGPLAEPVDLMVIYQQPNPGIKYQYRLPVGPLPPTATTTTTDATTTTLREGVIKVNDTPKPQLRQADSTLKLPEKFQIDKSTILRQQGGELLFPYGNSVLSSDLQGYSGDEAPRPRPKGKGKKKKFTWKISGYSECSKPCGGGIQTAVVVCVKEPNQLTVPDRRCKTLEKPSPQAMRCNLKPCVAQWVDGEWSECSVTCGPGVQTREPLCRQEITPTLTMTVADGACLSPPSPTLQRTRPCRRPDCGAPPPQWDTGAWSQCSAKCGRGARTRSVLCASGGCSEHDRPASESECEGPPCVTSSQTHRHAHVWLYTEWAQQCSVGCGEGMQSRRVLCSAGPRLESLCDASIRPDSQRACSSDRRCSEPVWFTSDWAPCSASCGSGRQSRSVVCVREGAVVSRDHCEQATATVRPETDRPCRLGPCGPQWYASDWSQCSRTCDAGVQRRDVRCLDDDQLVALGCVETDKPAARRSCNTHKCTPKPAPSLQAVEYKKNDSNSIGTAQNENSLRDQPQPQTPDSERTDSDSDCVDKFRNCQMVVQARLCKYKYYRMSCCRACRDKL